MAPLPAMSCREALMEPSGHQPGHLLEGTGFVEQVTGTSDDLEALRRSDPLRLMLVQLKDQPPVVARWRVNQPVASLATSSGAPGSSNR
jgi:hypothetical protein